MGGDIKERSVGQGDRMSSAGLCPEELYCFLGELAFLCSHREPSFGIFILVIGIHLVVLVLHHL